jgi:anti-sigma-K factor RskA
MRREEARIALGAYVVGALEPDERAEVDRWLETDAELREELARLAALPGLLARLHEPDVGDGAAAADSPAADRLVLAAARERRAARRRLRIWQAAAGVAAAVALAVGAFAVVRAVDDESPVASAQGPQVAVAVVDPAAAAAGMTGVVRANPRGWGAEVVLELWDVPYSATPTQYTMRVVARDGHTEQAAAWGSTPTGDCRVTGATSIQAAEITRVEVLAGDGPVLATATLL